MSISKFPPSPEHTAEKQAHMRARVMYYYMVGEFSILLDETDTTRLDMLKNTNRFLTS